MVELHREEDWWLAQVLPPHQHTEGHVLAKGARMVVAPHRGQEIHPHYKKDSWGKISKPIICLSLTYGKT
jgi:hypothetical protein